MANIYDSAVEVARRTMVLFFIVDSSSSMRGEKIGTLNQAVEDVLPELRGISEENADAQIKIACLRFASGASWLTPAPVEASKLSWNWLEADGYTEFGAACRELNSKLSRNAYMSDAAGSFAPAIFLLSDGEPTDDYVRYLGELWQNNWFKKAIKVAVAIGSDANTELLSKFTGTPESVLTVHSPEALKNMIRFVSVTASQIGSKSSAVGATGADEVITKQEEFVSQVRAARLEDANDGGLVW